MKRTLAATAVLALSLLVAGCATEDDADARATDTQGTSPAAAGSEDEGYPRGAEVEEFCGVLAEINDSIDAAGSGSEAKWDRIVAAFDSLDETGVPDDFSDEAVTALERTEALVRQSDSVPELWEAIGTTPPDSTAVDDYVSSNCRPA